MLGDYRAALGTPGAVGFSVAGLALRLPLAMYPISLVLLATLGGMDYAVGSSLTAGFIIGGAVGGPLLSRVGDRRGQRAVILPATCAHVACLGVLLALVSSSAPLAASVLAAGAAGLVLPPVGALVRARWVHLLADGAPRDGGAAGRAVGVPASLSTGLTLEATFDELTYVTGPVLASVLATTVDRLAPFALITVLSVLGGVGLHRQRTSTPPAGGVAAAAGLRLPGALVALVVVMVAVGATLIAVDLAAIAVTTSAGRAGWSGAVLACFSAGSACAGLAYGARRWRRGVRARLPVVALAFALLPVVLVWAVSLPVLAVQMLVVGAGTAPMLITVFGVAEQVVPAERVTEAMAWLTTGLSLGAGGAAPLIGVLTDGHGSHLALALPLCAAVAAGLLSLIAHRVLTRSRAHTGRSSTARAAPTRT